MEKQASKEKYAGVIWLVSWFRIIVLYFRGSSGFLVSATPAV